MKGDAGRLRSGPARHQKPTALTTPDALTLSSISNIPMTATESADDLDIHDHFKLRLQTYKTWAHLISRKSCGEILIDSFKSDISNDFTLMINWLAIASEESRLLVESSCCANETMELDVALDMLFRMGVPHKSMKGDLGPESSTTYVTLTENCGRKAQITRLIKRYGPTLDAFRELIAVLCGGTRGRVPHLDFLANFTEASRFSDKTAADVIVKLVTDIFKLSGNATSAMDSQTTCSGSSISSPEVMRNADLHQPVNHINEVDCISLKIDPPAAPVADENDENRPINLAHCEEPSVSNAFQGVPSMTSEKPPSDSSAMKPATSTKPKRDIYAIRNRRAGKVGTHTASGECFVCGKSDGDLKQCGKKYSPSSFCSTKFHEKCIESYNAAEYNVDCLRKIVDETICPLHFCSTCYLERWKTTAVRGKLIECDSCFRAFHEQCCPAGFELYDDIVPARTKEGAEAEVKQTFTRCHSHCDFDSIPLVANKRSHLPFCCECENTDPPQSLGEDPLVKCSRCVRSFHEGCLTLNCLDMHNANPLPLCESCILGETLRIGQPVIAKFRISFYGATITKLEEYPKHCIRMDKYGKHFNEPGYLSVKWAGCENLYALLPARSVVAMFTGSYDLLGKRISEQPCREAWREMEQDLAVPRPTFDYVPEKYTKIKTSVYHPSCPKPRLDGCEESDSMCDCPATDSDRCGPNSKCTNRAILQECPEACEAIGSGCNNRGVSRKEINPAVEIREAPGKGMGAFAARDIPKGAFIAEYAGELISNKEMNRRVAEVTAHRNAEEKHYMMALDSQRIIDCKEKGNDASPNCKVETVYVVVSRVKRPNGFVVKYDKRIMISTTEDVPAGTELCFNYQMRQYNLGCPLPDCKCGAPNCTGTLGSTSSAASQAAASENNDDEESPSTSSVTKKRKKAATIKRTSKTELQQEPPEKKPKSRSRRSAPSAAEVSPHTDSDKKEENLVPNGRVNRPTVVFKRASSASSKTDMKPDPILSPVVRRQRTRRTLNGLKDESSENMSNDTLLKRALLKGEALERRPSPSPQESNEVLNGLRRVHRLAVEFSSPSKVA